MSRRKGKSTSGSMLELWRPPRDAGDPVGCLATTFTFNPALFDEQCLGRFLEIESEPDREDLPFLLERETRLGSVYAGVMVDHTQAGVEHSLRWDVLPVRIGLGKQHAKLSLLAWSRHMRIVVASSNITEPGYRTNYEVAAAVDLKPDSANLEVLGDAVAFLRSLLEFVPGASDLSEVDRARAFLDQVTKQTRGWKPTKRWRTISQRLVCTLPATGLERVARSGLEEAVKECRRVGTSPQDVWIASPFFDDDRGAKSVTAALCKRMAQGKKRRVWFGVPVDRAEENASVPRLGAPKALMRTPSSYRAHVYFEILPDVDPNKNRRIWHAKMMQLRAKAYSALMIGSSNFTVAGMGVGEYRNAEANLLTIVRRGTHGLDVGYLESIWPKMDEIEDPENAEWLGALPERDEEQQTNAPSVPAGFLSATYRAGDERQIVLRLDPARLPKGWRVHACGRDELELLSKEGWKNFGGKSIVSIAWAPVRPPERILVRWDDKEAFMPLNVEDNRGLPAPEQLEGMTAEDMLLIVAAADPRVVSQSLGKERGSQDSFDPEMDSATTIDLDPLRRYDLRATFLHRVRRRARVLAQVRENLERPVWGKQALEWRLRGLIGISALAERLMRELEATDGDFDERLLTLADFLIVLREVDYKPGDGCLSKAEFEKIYRPFLRELSSKLDDEVRAYKDRVSGDMMQFWSRVVERCAV